MPIRTFSQNKNPKLIVTRSPIPSSSNHSFDPTTDPTNPSDPSDPSEPSPKPPKIKIPPDDEYKGDCSGEIAKCILCCCAFGSLLGVLIKFG